MRALRKWMKLRTPDTRRDYVTARTDAERIKRAEKRNVWMKIGDNLREDHAGTMKLLYSMAKTIEQRRKIQHAQSRTKKATLSLSQKELWRDGKNISRNC